MKKKLTKEQIQEIKDKKQSKCLSNEIILKSNKDGNAKLSK